MPRKKVDRQAPEVKKLELILPTLLSFKRRLEITDGLMRVRHSADPRAEAIDLAVFDHGQRTTKSHEVTKGPGDTQRSGEDSGNLINGQQAKIPPHYDTLEVTTHIKVLPLLSEPNQCDNDQWHILLKHSIESMRKSDELRLLGRYYAFNMLNGSWLWRNRTVADQIEVTIRYGEKIVRIDDALDLPVTPVAANNGEKQDDPHMDCRAIDDLANDIADALAGVTRPLRIEMTACARMMPGQAVWPSQRFTPSKRIVGKQPNGKEIFSGRDFLLFGGAPVIAAEKIGCALRTFDRDHRHPIYTDEIIPVEPNGGSLRIGINLRRSGNDIRSLLPIFAAMSSPQHRIRELDDRELLYVLACLIRGGVFGGNKSVEEKTPLNQITAEA